MKKIVLVASLLASLLMFASSAGASPVKKKPRIVTGVYHGIITYVAFADGQGQEGGWEGLFQGQGKVKVTVTKRRVSLSATIPGSVSHLTYVPYQQGNASCGTLAPNGFGGKAHITGSSGNYPPLKRVDLSPLTHAQGGFNETCSDGYSGSVNWIAPGPQAGFTFHFNVTKTLHKHAYTSVVSDGEHSFRLRMTIK